MEFDPLYAFVFAGLFSPGPNVILITTSGARFGVVRTFPHLLGVAAGVGVIAGITGLGLGAVLQAMPRLTFGLKIVAAVWILVLAWQLFRSTRLGATPASARPFKFYEGVLFQWVNPKIWAVALAASAGYSQGLPPAQEAIRLALAFSGLNIFVLVFWSLTGQQLSKLLSSETAWSRLMTAMALLLGLSAIMVFI